MQVTFFFPLQGDVPRRGACELFGRREQQKPEVCGKRYLQKCLAVYYLRPQALRRRLPPFFSIWRMECQACIPSAFPHQTCFGRGQASPGGLDRARLPHRYRLWQLLSVILALGWLAGGWLAGTLGSPVQSG